MFRLERERDGGPITQIIGLERRKVADNCLGSSSSLTFLWQHGGMRYNDDGKSMAAPVM